MRFERLRGAERRIWDWPVKFQHLRCFSGFGNCLCSPSTCITELICGLYGHLRLKGVACARGGTGLRVCAHRAHWRYYFRIEGMILMRLFRDESHLISQVQLRSARLCGKGDYYLLSMSIRPTSACGATQYSGLWQLTLTRRAANAPDQLPQLKRTTPVWNIGLDDSPRTEDEIHLGLQNVQKG